MAKSVLLKANPRTITGRGVSKRLRREGRVPAILYGKRIQPLPLDVNSRELGAVVHHHAGDNVLVDLEYQVDGRLEKRLALIQDVQQDPINGEFLHVDLHEIAADEKIRAHVSIESTGEPIGVKTFGGILENILREITVECLPKDLPEKLVIDVTPLNVGESIHVRDLPLPDGVVLVSGAELVVFAVAAPTVAEEKAPGAEAAVQPEVIKEKKPAEGEAAKDEGKKK